jgi:mannose-6-phosphate isomerase-like protein (cupin superfamily)
MLAIAAADFELAEAFIEGDATARWRSAAGHSPSVGARASGSAAEVRVADDRTELSAGGIAVVPEGRPHEVRNPGNEPLRFVAVTHASGTPSPDDGRTTPRS